MKNCLFVQPRSVIQSNNLNCKLYKCLFVGLVIVVYVYEGSTVHTVHSVCTVSRAQEKWGIPEPGEWFIPEWIWWFT